MSTSSSQTQEGVIRDLALRDGRLFAAMGPWGLKVLDSETLAEKDRLQGPGMGGATALSWCGGRLCISRSGVRGLTVVEPGWNGSPYVLAEHRTDGGAEDIAVRGGRIYLAHGNGGVGVYHLASPSTLAHLESFLPGAEDDGGQGGGKKGKGQGGQKSAKIVSVAVLDDRLLAAASPEEVFLYDLRSGRSMASTISLPGTGKLERVRFRGSQLWLLSAHPERLDIYDVSAPASPLHLGQVTEGAAEEHRAVYAGKRRYSFGANLLSSYRMEPLSP